MKHNPFPLWGVVMGGPTLCGGVAVFTDKTVAESYAREINDFNMYRPYAEKDVDGISKAWKMGDGKCAVIEIVNNEELAEFFIWE